MPTQENWMRTPLDRRDALAAFGALGAATLATTAFGQPVKTDPRPTSLPGPEPNPVLTPSQLGFDPQKGEYVLPDLPYPKDALDPHIDAMTMDIHHGKHHAAYVAGLNKALRELKAIREGGDAALVKHWSRELSFHGSGHFNHTLFWNMMAPPGKGGGGQPQGKLAEAISRDFGGFDKFTAHFKAAANQVEGGGWAWVVYEPNARSLNIIQEEKQQDMMLTGARPILGLDVWEHAYYLKYQNRRSDYVNAWFNVVNWGFAGRLFDQASA
jgi:Fe-Mn family superoxide dismutase